MKTLLQGLGFNLLACGLVLAAAGADIELVDGYVRGLPPSVQNTAAYLTLRNHSAEDLVLRGARTPAAGQVMLHESYSENGQLGMRHADSAVLPAGGDLVLESGGLHLMVSGLKGPLAPGAEVELTLIFEGGLEKTLALPVRDVRTESGSH